MNVFTQAVLYWTLLGLLLVWMIICAILALRPESKERTTTLREHTPVPSNALAFTPAPTTVQTNTPQHAPALIHAGNVNHDTSPDLSKVSIM